MLSYPEFWKNINRAIQPFRNVSLDVNYSLIIDVIGQGIAAKTTKILIIQGSRV